jgi:hypothetical protein
LWYLKKVLADVAVLRLITASQLVDTLIALVTSPRKIEDSTLSIALGCLKCSELYMNVYHAPVMKIALLRSGEREGHSPLLVILSSKTQCLRRGLLSFLPLQKHKLDLCRYQTCSKMMSELVTLLTEQENGSAVL